MLHHARSGGEPVRLAHHRLAARVAQPVVTAEAAVDPAELNPIPTFIMNGHLALPVHLRGVPS